MSYRLKLDSKSRKAAKFISKLQRKIQAELIESGMTQQEVADRLGVDRSVVNRRLKGSANLTARSIAEFADAFEKEVEVRFVSRTSRHGSNGAEVINGNLMSQSNVLSSPASSPRELGAVSLESVAS